jgi:hypothetical protein
MDRLFNVVPGIALGLQMAAIRSQVVGNGELLVFLEGVGVSGLPAFSPFHLFG